jgi:hypothetical protein
MSLKQELNTSTNLSNWDCFKFYIKVIPNAIKTIVKYGLSCNCPLKNLFIKTQREVEADKLEKN